MILVSGSSSYLLDPITKKFTYLKKFSDFLPEGRMRKGFSYCLQYHDGFIYAPIPKGLAAVNSKLEIEHLIETDRLPLKENHQSRLYGDQVFVADTGHDRLAIFNLNSRKCRSVFLTDSESDTLHFNSMYMSGGGPRNNTVFMMFHNFQRPSVIAAINIFFDNTKPVRLTEVGTRCHDIFNFPKSKGLWVCDSHNGQIIESFTRQTVKLGGYTRGVDHHDGLTYIGCSTNYNVDPDWKPVIAVLRDGILQDYIDSPIVDIYGIKTLSQEELEFYEKVES